MSSVRDFCTSIPGNIYSQYFVQVVHCTVCNVHMHSIIPDYLGILGYNILSITCVIY